MGRGRRTVLDRHGKLHRRLYSRCADAHHLHIDYVGAWNERPYEGDSIKALARALKQANLGTKIVCCDAYPGLQYGEWSIVDGMQNDPELRSAVAVVGVHYPSQASPSATPVSAIESGKALWASEDQPNPGGGTFLSRSWPVGGRVLAKQYISNYNKLKLTKTEIWSPITSYYDALAAPNSGLMYANTPWSGHFDVQSTIWVTSQATQFAQPGWQYLDGASGSFGGDVNYVSLRSPDRKQWSVVLETIDAVKPATMTFALKGGLEATTVHVWQTNDTHTFEEVAKLKAKDGSFTYTFEPGSLYSLTSTTGQGRHQTKIPPPAPFPFPYAEDFGNVSIGRSPRFLADQDGAFEVNPCTGRPGKCLVQQIGRKPTPWFPLPNPFTLAGGIQWRNYAIEVDVQIPKFGLATVRGRIESADVFQEPSALNPAGYVFVLNADGRWQVTSTAFKKPEKVLASGNAGDLSTGWHHVRLSLREARINADLDGKRLADVEDTDHTGGMIAVGSAWSKTAFSKLSVTPH